MGYAVHTEFQGGGMHDRRVREEAGSVSPETKTFRQLNQELLVSHQPWDLSRSASVIYGAASGRRTRQGRAGDLSHETDWRYSRWW
jgi:hypothetical protein